MDSIIIGIHGLRNKPPKYVITNWWKKSIVEGFESIRLPILHFRLEMAYWAQYLHTRAQNSSITDPDSPQYLDEPYSKSDMYGPRDPDDFGKRISDTVKQQLMQLIAGKTGFMNHEKISDIILNRMFVELDAYYHKKLRDGYRRLRAAKEIIRDELARVIVKHRKKSIMIVAHSMGSIIAYDVLTHVVPDIPVHTLITFGSPLGFPVIRKKIHEEMHQTVDSNGQLPTPANIQRRWLNFSDLEDVTCMDYNLRNHYRENSNGVRPFDQIVYNNYIWKGCRNPHKAYGYLRTAELCQAVYNFLVLENANVWQRMKWVFAKPVI